MTASASGGGTRAVLLDIEGTTTPLSFVREVLFPFARARLAEALAEIPESERINAALEREHGSDAAAGLAPPPWVNGAGARVASAAAYAGWLMDHDRKSTALKALQGRIWDAGYRAGVLRGLVFPDVPGALQRWHDAGITLAVYSSGSELAQRKLFESTEPGDLTPLFTRFFDTRIGAKRDADSYRAIARVLECLPESMLFLSDVTAELHAAQSAGVRVILLVRPGNDPQPDAGLFETAMSFDEINPGASTLRSNL